MSKNNIFVKNIYYMLSYAFHTLNQNNYEAVSKEDFDNVHDLLSAILAKGVSRQLKQGLYREYVNKVEEQTALRGKINIAGTIKNKFAKKALLTCEYDELSENNLYNQIIKSTALFLFKYSSVKNKAELKKLLLFFSAVDLIDLPSIRWTTIRFSRNNQTYRMLISICQMIVESMIITKENGEYKILTFFNENEMPWLYEKFILEYYRKEYPNLKVNASQIPWALDDEVGTMLPIMQSDITISNKEKVLIIDAKYYNKSLAVSRFDKQTIISSNLYQIFTYTKNAQVSNKDKTVAGMLLYAKPDAEIELDNTYKMSGNTISVKSLDLNTDFSLIKESLNLIVDNYFNK